MPQVDNQIVRRELLILASLVTLTCTIIAWGQPSTHDSLAASDWPTFSQWHAWVLLQSASLVVAVLFVTSALAKLTPRLSQRLSPLLLLAIPAIMVADGILFRWIGERFLSNATWRILWEFPTRLYPFTTRQMITDAVLVVVTTFAALFAIRYLASWLARRWKSPNRSRWVTVSCLLGLLALTGLGAAPLLEPSVTLSSMAADSCRHPLCVFRLIHFRGVHPSSATLADVPQVGERQGEGTRSTSRRQLEQRLVTVDPGSTSSHSPDVLVVIVESFRRELVTAETMPSLFSLAQKGLHCRQHFSGGNSTNLGMFSLVNGLEAIWYQQPVTYTPLLNRLFHTAGYEIGFFAGHQDWRLFMMDGFIDPSHYDVFESAEQVGLVSDRQATEQVIRFLDRRDASELPSRPRLAVLYLYATHAIYHSYVDDQVFQPAADDRLRYPYDDSVRDQVWNRYKNSARTVDRLLQAVMRDDCVIVITGDHGEAFLEDGTIGHGIRVSEYQNMTPAVVYAPGLSPRSIDSPTSHADLLPTLLAVAGIGVTHPSVFDGVNLLQKSDSELSSRVFATRNYLSDEYGLIGPWTHAPEGPFAWLASLSLEPPRFSALNPIDPAGYELPAHSPAKAHAAIQQWLDLRFAAPRP